MPYSMNKAIVNGFAEVLYNGVISGYGKELSGIAYNSPDHNMLENLQANVYQFAAAKNYQQLKSLTQALVGEDGKLRTFAQFKTAATQINDQHVNHWLKTEYNTAIASGQMASKWVEIKANQKTMGILEYDAVLDKGTTELCKGFHGIRKPVDDPFWSQFYPPNHFGCRSSVRQRSSGAITDTSKLVIPEGIPEMFKVNLGERGLAFPPGHPYWSGIPQTVLSDALKMLPEGKGFVTLEKLDNGGMVRVHRQVNVKAKDYNDVLAVANDFAKGGMKVDILPTLNTTDDPLYSKLFKGAKPGKYPDLRMGKTFIEVEKANNPNNINNLKNAIRSGSKQANYVVVVSAEDIDAAITNRVAKSRFIDHKDLQVVEIKMPGKTDRFTRNMFK